MRKRVAFGIILVVILLAAGWSCMGTGPAPTVQLSVLKHEMIKDAASTAVVKVTVKNTSRAVAELAEVKVNFYDAEKNLIDSSSDSVMNLRPDEIWDFEITCSGERCGEVSSYDIKTTAGASSGGL
jgi:hypothetical protein